MKSNSASETVARVRNSNSESFRKLNPQLFTHSEFDVKIKQPEMLRQNKTGLNKLETEYFQILKFVYGDKIRAQAMTLKIGNGVRYTPDFTVWHEGRYFAYETKGFMREDAAVKIKVAAREYPEIDFRLVWKTDGRWNEQRILP